MDLSLIIDGTRYSTFIQDNINEDGGNYAKSTNNATIAGVAKQLALCNGKLLIAWGQDRFSYFEK